MLVRKSPGTEVFDIHSLWQSCLVVVVLFFISADQHVFSAPAVYLLMCERTDCACGGLCVRCMTSVQTVTAIT